MIEALKTLHEISQLEGKGKKKSQIELLQNGDSPELRYLLDIGFNPFIKTKLNKLEVLKTPGQTVTEANIEPLKDILNELITSKSANNEKREIIGSLIGSFDLEPHLETLLVEVVTKNLSVGFQASTINKAYGANTIPDPSLMLAKEAEGIIENMDEIFCEVKYDGVRLCAIISDGQIRFFSRNFNEVDADCLSRIRKDIMKLLDSDLSADIFLDGELTDFNRKTVSGKFNKILKGTAPQDIDKDFVFTIFDIENVSVLDTGTGVSKFRDRRARLEQMFREANESQFPISSHTQLATQYVVSSKAEVLEIYDSIVEDGGEGVICKNGDHVYRTKRTTDWIKFKQIQDCDLRIVAYELGKESGKRAGKLGALVCESECGQLRVDVGSGFTDAELAELWEEIQNGGVIGDIATIKYNERITDKYGNHSLFLPRFVERRSDKTVANTLEEIS